MVKKKGMTSLELVWNLTGKIPLDLKSWELSFLLILCSPDPLGWRSCLLSTLDRAGVPPFGHIEAAFLPPEPMLGRYWSSKTLAGSTPFLCAGSHVCHFYVLESCCSSSLESLGQPSPHIFPGHYPNGGCLSGLDLSGPMMGWIVLLISELPSGSLFHCLKQ